jgi:hypothetical protein
MEIFASSSIIGFFPFGSRVIVKNATTFGLMYLNDAI